MIQAMVNSVVNVVVLIVDSDIKFAWVGCGTMWGINGNQLGGFGKDFFDKYPMENSGTIPKTGPGMPPELGGLLFF